MTDLLAEIQNKIILLLRPITNTDQSLLCASTTLKKEN